MFSTRYSNKCFTTAYYNDDKIYGNYIQTDSKTINLNTLSTKSENPFVLDVGADFDGIVFTQDLPYQIYEDVADDISVFNINLSETTSECSVNILPDYYNNPGENPLLGVDLVIPKVVRKGGGEYYTTSVSSESVGPGIFKTTSIFIPPGVAIGNNLTRLRTNDNWVDLYFFGYNPVDTSEGNNMWVDNIICESQFLMYANFKIGMRVAAFVATDYVLDFRNFKQINLIPGQHIVDELVAYPSQYFNHNYLIDIHIGPSTGGLNPSKIPMARLLSDTDNRVLKYLFYKRFV